LAPLSPAPADEIYNRLAMAALVTRSNTDRSIHEIVGASRSKNTQNRKFGHLLLAVMALSWISTAKIQDKRK